MFLQNFIHIGFHRPYSQMKWNGKFLGFNDLDRFDGLFMHHHTERGTLMDRQVDLRRYIIDMLDQDYYVYFLCDTCYIDQYPNFQGEHNRHTLLVYGYDLADEAFCGYDFFDYVNASRRKCRMNQVVSSIVNTAAINQRNENQRIITAIKVNKDFTHILDLQQLKDDLT